MKNYIVPAKGRSTLLKTEKLKTTTVYPYDDIKQRKRYSKGTKANKRMLIPMLIINIIYKVTTQIENA